MVDVVGEGGSRGMAIGRPLEYTQEMGDKICFGISSGRSLKSVCSDDNMPHFVTVLRWVQRVPAFRNQYAEAREIQAEVWAEEIVDIADDNAHDMKVVMRGEEAVETLDFDHVQRAKLKVDARKWVAARLLPKKYGEPINARVGDPDFQPIESSDIERAARVAALLDTARTRRTRPADSNDKGVGASSGASDAGDSERS